MTGIKIEAVVLAAGHSKRFGTPKALARFQNKTLLETAIDAAKASQCSNVNVVLGAHQDIIQEQLSFDGVRPIMNANFSDGMSSSIIAAVSALRSADAILFMTTDQPLINATQLNLLCNCYTQNSNTAVAAQFGEDFGIPAIFPASLFSQLLKLSGDKGAKSVLRKNRIMTLPIESAQFDIDTPEDLRKLIQRTN